MPLIRLMSTSDKNTTSLLKGTILEPDGAPFDQIVRLIKGSDAIDYTKEKALRVRFCKSMSKIFKENNAKKELMELISFIHKRKG